MHAPCSLNTHSPKSPGKSAFLPANYVCQSLQSPHPRLPDVALGPLPRFPHRRRQPPHTGPTLDLQTNPHRERPIRFFVGLINYNLNSMSPCAPENNSAGLLIGAWPVGCGANPKSKEGP